MKKLILTTLLLFLVSPVQASTLSEIKVFDYGSDSFYRICPSNSSACAFTSYKEIYMNTDKIERKSVYYQFTFYHEVCHILIRPFYPEYLGDKEEKMCNDFAGYVLTGTDKGNGLFQKMILAGISEK